jgi:hypothetical protein
MDIRKICQYFSVSSWLFPRERLVRKLHAILDDDVLLRKDGIDSLSDADIEQALLDRGFLRLHTEPTINREWLNHWIRYTHLDSPLSMLITCRILHICR